MKVLWWVAFAVSAVLLLAYLYVFVLAFQHWEGIEPGTVAPIPIALLLLLAALWHWRPKGAAGR